MAKQPTDVPEPDEQPEEEQAEQSVEFPEHGSIVTSHEVNPDTGQPDPSMPVAETEKIVHDKDKDGNVVGWHKEAV